MRRTPLLLLPALLVLPALAVTPAVVTATKAPTRAVPAVTAAGLDALTNRAEPGDEMLGQRGGVIPTGAWARANAQSQQIAAATAKSDPRLAAAAWSLKGPTNIGGRVLDVVVDPLRRDSVYVATASGGVWHSTDAGRRFSSASRAASSSGMSSRARSTSASRAKCSRHCWSGARSTRSTSTPAP